MGEQVTEQSVMAQILGKLQEAGAGLRELAAAYVQAWGELPTGVTKDANNPHFGNDYATLGAHLAVIKPVFAKHGLALLQAPGQIVDGNITVETMLIHKSGQYIAIKTHVPLGGKSTAQTMGSATTYGKRYVAGGVGGLAPADEDDGEAASQTAPATRGKSTPKPTKNTADAGDADGLIARINDFSGTAEELEKTLRPEVESLGNKDVNRAYIARRRQLKESEGK